ncbi:MAG TPA: TonB-dependent receptor plug domain-containing protein [bacterium]|nr:TonB-dependent receptor plug domain-containing protein [bacterium]
MRALVLCLFLGLPLAAHAYDEVPQSVYDAGGQDSSAAVSPAAGAASSVSPSASASGTTPSASESIDLSQVTVQGRAANLVGIAGSASCGSVGQADLSERALLRPAEVLEAVPGMLITQHSGDGKANQYFTRGFNLDHGTDFAFSMDGVPVNEESNAHGQGYSDLNFMIPELVKTVNYTKGPFNVEVGDFATAGSANFVYPTVLKSSIASLTMGQFGYQRALAASQTQLLGGNLIFALEIDNYDGPWDTPEQFKKYNGFLRYSRGTAGNQWVLSYSAYEASWYATNQMPQDAIDQGLINSFGNLSPTDGGDRSRDFLWATWTGKTGGTETDLLGYVGVSHLHLWNDFEFNLPYAGNGGNVETYQNGAYSSEPADEALAQGFAQDQFADPALSEQFEESDDRTREGASARYKFPFEWRGLKTRNEAGLDFRNDNIMLGLFNTVDRDPYEVDSENHVVETSAAPYVQNTTEWTPWLKSVLAFRQDFYYINVVNETPTLAQQVADGADPSRLPADQAAFDAGYNEGAGIGSNATYHASMPEPKAALIVHPEGSPVEAYLNFGQGYHSNDVRELAGGINPLAQADGEEAGLRYARGDTYETTFAVWRLTLASELTFDGDTAASVTNAASTRQGIEWSNTYRAKPFYVDLDGALSQARFDSEDTLDDPEHPGYWVPEAIEQVGTLTVGMDKVWGWSADARVRYFGSRALTADNAVRSSPDTLVSLQILRDLWAGQTLSFDVFNLFNQQADDVSYYYAYALTGVDSGASHESVMAHVTEPLSVRVSWMDHF